MDLPNRSERNVRVFLSHRTDDEDLLSQGVHIGSSERNWAVDAVRQRLILQYRTALSEKLNEMPNSDEFRVYFDEYGGSAAVGRSGYVDVSRILSVFLSGQTLETFIGDLEERYRALLNQKGRHATNLWFWRQVVHSFFSLAFDALRKVSGLETLMERFRRIGN